MLFSRGFLIYRRAGDLRPRAARGRPQWQMNNGFILMDIIILAAITALLVIHLFRTLGKRGGHENKPSLDRFKPLPKDEEGDDTVVPLPDRDGTARAKRLELAPGDVLALISDGVYEYAAADGSQFGEQRVADVFAQSHELSMAELSQNLVDAAFEFGGDAPQADDITLVLVRRLPDKRPWSGE